MQPLLSKLRGIKAYSSDNRDVQIIVMLGLSRVMDSDSIPFRNMITCLDKPEDQIIGIEIVRNILYQILLYNYTLLLASNS